jgi:hypothetical protein
LKNKLNRAFKHPNNDTVILILLVVMVIYGNAVQVEFSSGYSGELNRIKSSRVNWHKSNPVVPFNTKTFVYLLVAIHNRLSTRVRQVLMERNISPTSSVEMVMKTRITYFFVASSLKKSGLQFCRNVA